MDISGRINQTFAGFIGTACTGSRFILWEKTIKLRIFKKINPNLIL